MSVPSWFSSPAIASMFVVVVLALSCKNDTSSSSVEAPTPAGADASNVGEASIYEVDPEDPYLIFNGTFFDLAPGQPIASSKDRLRKGQLETGDGTFDVFYIDGLDKEELGYLMPDPNDESLIGDIYLTSERVVTERGLRVGNTFSELIERLGEVEVHGSEIEGYTQASAGRLRYRLDEQHFTYELSSDAVAPSAKVLEIVIPRP